MFTCCSLTNAHNVLQELLNMMADVNVHDNMQNTPLIWAAFLARSEVMKILLRYSMCMCNGLSSVCQLGAVLSPGMVLMCKRQTVKGGRHSTGL